MTDYPFEMQLVVDPDNPSNVVRGGAVSIYDPTDMTGTVLLALKDPSGLPLANPMMSNAYGFISPHVTTVPQTKWKSGTFEGYFSSFEGLRAEAVAARLAAEKSEASAAEAAARAVAPTDAQVDAAVLRATWPSNLALAPDGVPYVLSGANDVIVHQADDGHYYFTTK